MLVCDCATCRALAGFLKKVEDDPSYDKSKAKYLLKIVRGTAPHAIREKVELYIEHFAATVQGEIGGRAKAMVSPLASARGALQAGGG